MIMMLLRINDDKEITKNSIKQYRNVFIYTYLCMFNVLVVFQIFCRKLNEYIMMLSLLSKSIDKQRYI